MEDEVKKADEVDARTRAQAVKQLNKERSEQRASRERELSAWYAEIRGSEALKDILAKGHQFAEYHTKLAIDGLGTRNMGEGKYEEYVLSPEERVSELDQAKGMKQLIAYIERKVEL